LKTTPSVDGMPIKENGEELVRLRRSLAEARKIFEHIAVWAGLPGEMDMEDLQHMCEEMVKKLEEN